MSQIPPGSVRSSNDARRAESRSSFERKRSHPEGEDPSFLSEGRESMRSRRHLSWHPSAPLEPPLKSTQHRLIGVHSILNHPGKEMSGASTAVVHRGRREALGEQLPSNSPSHSRFSSSSTVHLPSPSMHSAKPPALSSGMRNSQNITPHSPTARFVNAGGYYPQKAGASQSPLAQLPGLQTVAPGSPLPLDPVSGHPHPVHSHQQSASMHSTPTFASHRPSTSQTPNLSPKETSPTTPMSVFSQLGRSSPAPQSAPMFLNSPYGSVDPVARLPSVVAGQRHTGEEATGMGGSQSGSPLPGMIPCFLDLKSGSSSQAEKRKANSDASRRFRNRKRNEMQMEQKITSQQDEIRKQVEMIQKQAQELRALAEQRDFYRSERDFFRDHLTRFVTSDQLPTRPTSPPRVFRSSFETTSSERDHKTSWTGADVSRKIGETNSGPTAGPLAPATTSTTAAAATAVVPTATTTTTTARAPGTWSTTPAAYPPAHPERTALPDDSRQTRSTVQTPGAWNRPT